MLTMYQKKWLRQHATRMIFLLFLVIGCYVMTLQHAFLSDDIAVIQNNPLVGDFGNAFIRPQSALRTLLYTTIYTVTGADPTLFRLSNILFHAGSVLLLYAIVCAFGFELIAFFAASIFAVHPLVTESVTWISGGTYAQYGFFFLAAFLFYLMARRSVWRYILSIFFFILALWTSEKATVFPLLLVWYELCFGSLKESYKRLLPYFALAGALGAFYISQIGQRVESLQTNFYQSAGVMNPLYQIPIALSSYLILFMLPLSLSFYHSELVFTKTEFFLRSVLVVIYFVLLAVTFKKQKFVAFWLGMFTIILLPTLTPLPIAWVVAERYVYLGIAALSVVLAWGLAKLVLHENTKYIGYGLFMIVILSLIPRTLSRNLDWRNQDYLWLATGKTAPNSPQNHNNLGDYYSRHGDFDQAIIEFKRAIELNPQYGDAFHNLGTTYQQKKDIPNAIANYERAIATNPNLWQSYQAIGYLLFIQNKFTEAETVLHKALKIAPQEPNIRRNLAIVLVKLHKEEEAKEIMRGVAR